MTQRARAAVQTGPGTVEMREMDLPSIGDDDALVRVEACGICGSDIELFRAEDSFFVGRRKPEYPVIRGHEPVGVIVEAGDRFLANRRLGLGDRVAIGNFQPCGTCPACLAGLASRCDGWGPAAHSYGNTPLATPPGLWGGFATHLFLSTHSIVHKVPTRIPGPLATLFNPLGAGIAWGVDLAGTRVGSTVVVLGSGQRGIACALAAIAAGAAGVVITGLSRDAHKLDIARKLGVTATVDVEVEDLFDVVRETFGSDRVDAVVDTSSKSVQPVADAIRIVRPEGTIVLGGLKGQDLPSLPVDIVVRKGITMKGAYAVAPDAHARGIALLDSGRFDFAQLQTHILPLDRLEYAVKVLAGDVPGEYPLNVVVTPA